jgi:hypothetical protein
MEIVSAIQWGRNEFEFKKKAHKGKGYQPGSRSQSMIALRKEVLVVISIPAESN